MLTSTAVRRHVCIAQLELHKLCVTRTRDMSRDINSDWVELGAARAVPDKDKRLVIWTSSFEIWKVTWQQNGVQW